MAINLSEIDKSIFDSIETQEGYREHLLFCLSKREFKPQPHEIFRMFRIVKMKDIRIVIMGQDPYNTYCPETNLPYAYGIGLYRNPLTKVEPKSLQIVIDELYRTHRPNRPNNRQYKDYHHQWKHGTYSNELGYTNHNSGITRNTSNIVSIPCQSQYYKNKVPRFSNNEKHLCLWMAQGVFLTNVALTVGNNRSHLQLWTHFTQCFIRKCLEINKDILFVLLGSNARKIVEDNFSKLNYISLPHPVARTNVTKVDMTSMEDKKDSFHRSFYGCNMFLKIDEYLQSKGLCPISWIPKS
jgi:uracil DNA glycosylase